MTKKEKIIKKMQGLLAEVSELNDEDITDANYREYYENAADELDRYEEDEEGESDIYKFTYNILDEYVDLKNELIDILKAEGLNKEQRKQFYQLNFCQEAEHD